MKELSRFFAIVFVSLMLVSMVSGSISLGFASAKTSFSQADSPKIYTDKADYHPGETVTIYGTSFLPKTFIDLNVTKQNDGTNTLWKHITDANGNFKATYQIGSVGAPLYTVKATDGTNTATTTFTDSLFGLDSSCQGFGSSSSSSTITTTSMTAQANELIIVVITQGSSSSSSVRTFTLSDSFASGDLTYTLRGTTSNTPGSGEEAITEYYAVTDSSHTGPFTITATASGSGRSYCVEAFGIMGANTASPFDTNAGLPYTHQSESAGVPTVTSVSTSNSNDIILGLEGQYDSTAQSTGSYFGGSILHNANTEGNNIGYKTVTAILSSSSIAFGTSVSNHVMLVDAVRQAPLTLGYPNGPSPTYSNSRYYFIADAVTPNSLFTVNSINVWGEYGGNCYVAIYDNNGGHPGNRLTSSLQVSMSSSGAWSTATVSPAINLNAGTTYWLALIFSANNGVGAYSTSNTRVGYNVGSYTSLPNPAPTNPSGGWQSLNSYIDCIYISGIATPTVPAPTLSPASPINYGGSVTSSVTLSAFNGQFIPTGTITFKVSTDGGSTYNQFGAAKTLSSGSATSDSYAPTSAGTNYRFEAVYTGDSFYNGATGAASALTVNQVTSTVNAPTFTPPGPINVGQSATVSATVSAVSGGATPTGSITFRDSPNGGSSWTNFASNVALSSGSASASFTPSIAGNYIFDVIYSGDTNYASSTGGSSSSLTVNPGISVTLSPSSWAMDVSQSKQFMATPSGGSGSFASYQWYVGGALQSGQTASTFTFSSASAGSYSITTTVTDSLGATSPPSSPAAVTVNSALVAPSTSASLGTLDQGQASSLTSTAITTGTSPYTYQWLSEEPGSGSFSPISGATSSSYSFVTSTSTTVGSWSFEIQVTDNTGVSAMSSPATIVVVNSPIVAPTVTATPSLMDQGQTSSLTSSAVIGGTSPYTYQWMSKAPGSGSFSPISGATSSSYSFVTSTSTTVGSWSFELKVTDAAGASVTSSPSTVVVVNSGLNVPLPSTSLHVINQGQSSTISITGVSGGTTPYSYQWLMKAPGAGSYSQIYGATSSSYTFTTSGSTAIGVWSFEVQVNDAVGGGPTTSPAATVVVNLAHAVWDFEDHTYTHPDLTTKTNDEIASQETAMNSLFAQYGLPQPIILAYPNGAYNPTVISVVSQYRQLARTAGNGATYEPYPIPQADLYALSSRELAASTTFAQAQAWIDSTVQNKGWLNLFSHQITDDQQSLQNYPGCTPELLQAVLAYLKAQQDAGNLQVLTARQAYSSFNGQIAVVTVSFDDAIETDYSVAYPMFQLYGFAGTSYLIGSYVGQPSAMPRLTWAQVDEMAQTYPPAWTLTVNSNLPAGGSTSISGTITVQQFSLSVTATPASGYVFGGWSFDGTMSTANTITLGQGQETGGSTHTLTAYFIPIASSTVFQDGFDSGSFSPNWFASDGAPTIVSSPAHSGSYAAQAIGHSDYQHNLGGSGYSDVFFAGYVQVSQLPPNDQAVYLLYINDASFAQAARAGIYMNSAGTNTFWVLSWHGGWSQSSTPANVQTNHWYFIEVEYRTDATGSYARMWVDDNLVANAYNPEVIDNAQNVQGGNPSGATPAGFVSYGDDYLLSTQYIASGQAQSTCPVTVSVGLHGSSNIASQTVNWGTTLNFAFTPDTGYHISDVKVNGVSAGAVSSLSLTITAATTVDVTFAINTYPVTVTVGANGQSNLASQTVNWNTQLNFVFTPDPGYHVADVKVNGVSVGAQTSWSITVTAATTVELTFAINTYSVTVNVGANGHSNLASQTVDWNTQMNFVFTPNMGYHVLDVKVNGVSAGAVTTLSTPITAATTVDVAFAIDTYPLTVNVGANGQSNIASQTVNWNTQLSFVFTPDQGYHVSDVKVNGVSVGAVTSLSHTVTDATIIDVTFAINTYPVTVTIGANGQSNLATQTVNWNTQFNFVFTPDPGYHVLDVKVNGVSVGAQTTWSITIIAATTVDVTFAINTYPVTITVGAHGHSNLASQTVSWNTQLNFVFTPDAGYHVSDVKVDGVSSGAVTTLSITVTAAIGVDVSFAPNVYTLIVGSSPVSGGSTSLSGTVQIDQFSISVTATPATGYVFGGWSLDGNTIIDNPLTISAPMTAGSTHTLTVYFVPVASATVFGDGLESGSFGPAWTVSTNPPTLVSSPSPVHGGSNAAQATGNSYWQHNLASSYSDLFFAGYVQFPQLPSNDQAAYLLYLNDASFAESARAGIYTNSAGTSSQWLLSWHGSWFLSAAPANIQTNHWYFIEIEYSTDSIGSTARIWVDNNLVAAGFTSIPIGNAQSVQGGNPFGGTPAGFVSYGDDYAVATSYISSQQLQGTYDVTVNVGQHGSSNIASQTVNWGSVLNFVFTPEAGYHVADVKVNGVSVGAVTSLSITVTAATTVDVSFAINTYPVTVNVGAYGSTNIATQTVDWNTPLNFVFTADNGYHVADVKVNGVSVGAVATLSITVTVATTVDVTFAINTYPITITVGTHGQSNLATQTVDWNTQLNFVFTPDAGFHVSDVKVNGVSVGAVTSLSITVTDATTVDVSFAINTYAVTVTAGANGQSNLASQTFDWNTQLNFVFTPDAGYHVADVKVNGVSVGAVTSLRVTVTAITTVDVTFAINTYSVAVTVGANGQSNLATQTVDWNTQLNFVFTPDLGYHVADVKVNGVSVGAQTSWSITVTAATTVDVSFAINTYVVTVNVGANGQSNLATQTVNWNTQLNFIFTPNAGYHVSDVKVDGVSAGAVTTLSITVTAVTSVDVSFAANVYTLIVDSSPMSGGSTSLAGTVQVDQYSIAVIASPVSGYVFGGWSYDGNTIVDNPLTISGPMVAGSTHTLTAYFVPIASTTSFGDGFESGSFNPAWPAGPGSSTIVSSPVHGGSHAGEATGYSYWQHNLATSYSDLFFAGYVQIPQVPSNDQAAYLLYINDASFAESARAGIYTNSAGTSNQWLLSFHGSWFLSAAPANIQANHWYFVEVEYSTDATGSTARMWVDGNLVAAGFTSISVDNAQNVQGGNPFGGTPSGFISYGDDYAVATSYIPSQQLETSYEVTVNVGQHGSSNIASQTVNWGSILNFVFTPDTGYHVADVKVNGVSVGAVPTLSITVTGTTSVDVSFAINTYPVTVNIGAHGSSNLATQTVDWNTPLNFVFTPDNGYHVSDVKLNGVSVGAVTSLSITVTAATTVDVSFAINTYVVTVNVGIHGQSNLLTQTVDWNTQMNFVFTPDVGYHVADVKVNGVSVGAVTSLSITVTDATSVDVSFAINTYAVTVNVGQHGASNLASQTVDWNTQLNFIFTPDTGYHVSDVKVNGVSAGALTTLSITVTAVTSVDVSFAINTYPVTVNVGAHGQSNLAAQTVDWNTALNFVFTPDNGYHISDVKVNGVSVGAVTSLSITVTSATVVDVSFAINIYAVTVTVGDHGQSNIATQTVDWNTPLSFVFTPDAGYHVSDVKVNGISVGAVATLSITVTAATIVDVSFAVNVYTLIVDSSPVSGGSTSLAGTVQVDQYSIAVTASPANGYVFGGWSFDGNLLTVNPLAISGPMVAGSTHTLTAYFVAIVPSTVFQDGFENNNFNNWYASGSTTIVSSPSPVHSGSYAAQATGPSYWDHNIGSSYSDLFFAGHVLFPQVPPNDGAVYFLYINGASQSVRGGIYTSSSGTYNQWLLVVGGTWYLSSTAVNLQTNHWYFMEIEYNANGIARMWVDRVLVSIGSGQSLIGPANDVQAGHPFGATPAGFISYGDDYAVGTSYVVGQQPPTITAPTDITIPANALGGATGVSLGTPTYSSPVYDNSQLIVTNNAPTLFPLGTTTVTWAVTDPSGQTATATQIVTVHTDSFSKFTVANPGTVTAGTPFTLSIIAQDQWGNTITTYSTSVGLSASTGFGTISPTSASSSTGTWSNGVWSGTVTLTKSGTGVTIIADDGNGHAGTSTSFTVNAGVLASIALTGPASVVAGSAATFTAEGFDSEGNSLGDVTSSAVWSIDVAAQGSWLANVYTSKVSGAWTVTASIGSVSKTASLAVTKGVLASIALTGPASVVAGSAATFTAEGFDSEGNSLGDVTSSAVWSIDVAAQGSWLANVYTSKVSGAWTVTASIGSVSKTASLAVTKGVLASIALTGPASVVAGSAATFTAEGFDSEGNSLGDVTSSAVWSIDVAAQGSWLANVYTSKVSGAWTVTASIGSVSKTASLAVTKGVLASIALTGPASVVAGSAATFTAEGFDSEGNSLGDVTSSAVWSIDVAAQGSWLANVYTSKVSGAWTVTASIGSVSKTASLAVTKGVLASIALTGPASVVAGSAATFTAEGFDSEGNSLGDVTSSAVWSIDVAAQGSWLANVYTSKVSGAWTVTASIGSVSKTASLAVTKGVLASIALTGPASVVAGSAATFTAEGFDSEGNSLGDVTSSAVWSIDVAAQGSWLANVYTSKVSGAWTVTASIGSVSKTASLAVTKGVLASIALTGPASVVAGSAATFTAEGFDSEGNSLGDVTSSAVWSIDVAAQGSWLANVYTSKVSGAWTVTASIGSVSKTASLAVTKGVLASIALTGPASVVAGSAATFTAEGFDSEGNSLGDVTSSAVWSIDVAAQGSWLANVYTSKVSGAWTVTASIGSVSKTASLAVTKGVLASIALTGPASVVAGSAATFTAEGFDSEGNSLGDVTSSAVWSIDVAAQGSWLANVYTSKVSGAWTVTASIGSVSKTASLAVTKGVLASIALTGPASVVAGSAATFTAEGFDSEGNSLGDVTSSAVWSIDVAAQGSWLANVYTSKVSGAWTVTASIGSVSKTASLAVTKGVLASIALTGPASVVAGSAATFTAEGFDSEGNSLGDVTSSAVWSIDVAAQGSWLANVYTSKVSGAWTVTASIGSVSKTASLAVTKGVLASIALTGPASVVAGSAATFTAEGFDSEGNSLGDVTSSAVWSIDVAAQGSWLANVYTSKVSGAWTVTASIGSVSKTASLAVTKGVLASIALTGPASVVAGSAATFTAEGFDSEGNSLGDVTSSAVWSIDVAAQGSWLANVYTSKVSGAWTVTASIGSVSKTASLAVTKGVLASIALTGPASVVAGSAATFTAEGFDSEGNSLGDVTSSAVWSIDVAAQGSWLANVYTSKVSGAWTVTASIGSVSKTASLAVTKGVLASIALTGPASVVAGSAATFTAEGFDSEGNSLGDVTSSAVWSIDVAAQGSWLANVYTSKVSGAWTVTASIGSVSKTASLAVTKGVLASIALTGPASVVAGSAATFTAEGFDSEGNSLGDVTSSAVWSIDVAAQGSWLANVYTSKVSGAWTVTASIGSVSKTASLAVTKGVLASIALTGPASVVAGSAATFTAEGFDSEGNSLGDVTSSAVWSIDVAAQGSWLANVYTSKVSGAWTVTASIGSVSKTASLAVTKGVLASIALTGPASVVAGSAATFTAEGFDSEGNSLGDVTSSAVWSIDVAAQGSWLANVYTSKVSGAWTVTASIGSVSKTASLAVTKGVLASIALTGPASVVAGSAATFTAEGFDSEGNSLGDVTSSAVWSIDVAAQGSWLANVYTSKVSGAWTVTASIGSVSKTASLAVTKGVLASIALTGPASVVAGSAATFTAEGFDSEGNSLGDVTSSAVWSIDSSAKGSWSSNVYTAEVADSWTVSATVGAIHKSAQLTVNPAAASHFLVYAPISATAGTSFSITVTAYDAYSNLATGYAGTVHFTSTSAGTLPGDSTLTGGTGTFTVTLTTVGSQTITATDKITGSITGTSGSISVTAAIPPSTGISLSGTLGLNGWYDSSVTVTLMATDHSGTGIKAIHYILDSGSEQIVSGSLASFTVATAGTHSLAYWAVDNAGNIETQNTQQIKIDLTMPSTAAGFSGTLLSGTTDWYIGSVSVTLTANEPSSGIHYIYYSLNGGAWNTYTVTTALTFTASTSFTVSTQGQNTVRYYSVDYSGDTETTNTVQVNIAYTITPSAPGAGSGGSINPSTPQSVAYGATPTFTVAPDTGYHLLDLKVDGASVLSAMVGNSYTFLPISVNHDIVATFTVNAPVSPTYLVVRGADNLVYYRIYDAASGIWGSWVPLPGSTIDSPAAAVCGNELHIVVRGSDGVTLWHGYVNLNDGTFSGWTWISGSTPSAPTLVSNGNVVVLTVRGDDNMVYYRVYTVLTRTWGVWQVLPSGSTCDKVSAVMQGNELVVVVRGFSTTEAYEQNMLWQASVNIYSSAFSGWTWIPGSVTSSPTLTAWQNGYGYCLVVRGSDNSIYINKYVGSAWQGWTALPDGSTYESPAATVTGDKLCAIVVGIDGITLWQSDLDLNSNSFSGWRWISGTTPSKPTFTS